MDSATDTDSEADHLAVAPYPTRMALSPSFASPPAYKSSKLKDVHAALQELCTVETSLLVKVPRT
jgi:hypothetical protein